MEIIESYLSEPIQEQYYGNNPILSKIDSLFDDIISIVDNETKKQNYKGKEDLRAYYNYIIVNKIMSKTVNDIKQIEKLIEELFNFEKVRISLNTDMNAFSFFVDEGRLKRIIEDKDKLFIKTSNGIQFAEKQATGLINIGLMLFSLKDINGRMMTSLLLHELGHTLDYSATLFSLFSAPKIIMQNFFQMKNSDLLAIIKQEEDKKKGILPKKEIKMKSNKRYGLESIIKYISGVILRYPLLILMRKSIDLSKKDKNSRLYMAYFSTVFSLAELIRGTIQLPNILKNIKNYIQYLISLISGKAGKINYMFEILNIGTATRSKQKEMFADNFASSYGYGKELMRVLSLLSDSNKDCIEYYSDKNVFGTIITSLKDIINTTVSVLSFNLVGDHPNTIDRCIDQINYLKSQANNINDQELKKKLMDDIAECEKEYEKLKDEMNDPNYLKSCRFCSRLMNKIYTKMGGTFLYKLFFSHTLFNNRSKDGLYKQLGSVLSDDDLLDIYDSVYDDNSIERSIFDDLI